MPCKGRLYYKWYKNRVWLHEATRYVATVHRFHHFCMHGCNMRGDSCEFNRYKSYNICDNFTSLQKHMVRSFLVNWMCLHQVLASCNKFICLYVYLMLHSWPNAYAGALISDVNRDGSQNAAAEFCVAIHLTKQYFNGTPLLTMPATTAYEALCWTNHWATGVKWQPKGPLSQNIWTMQKPCSWGILEGMESFCIMWWSHDNSHMILITA